jgi:hypothetical protein
MELTSGSPTKIYKKTPNSWVYPFFDLITCMLCHVSTDNGVHLSENVLASLNRTISAHWNEFAQNRWFLQFRRIPIVLSISRANVVVFWN